MWRTVIIWIAVASSVAYVAAGIVAIAAGFGSVNGVLWLLFSGPPLVAAAAYLLWRRPDNPTGMLMMIAALTGVVIPTVLEVGTMVPFENGGPELWMWAPMWAAMTLGLIGSVAGAAMIGLLPDGRTRDAGERIFVPLLVILAPLPTLGLLTNPTVQTWTFQFTGVTDIASPIFVPALAALGPPVTAATFLANLVILVGIGALVRRYRRGGAHEQRQLRWVLLAGGVAVVVSVGPAAFGQLGLVPAMEHSLIAAASFLPSLLLPFAIVAAVVEPSWIDVDFVIRRSFVYGTLSALILAVYVAAAASIGLTAGAELPIELAILLTVVVAVALQPVRVRLQAWADRRVFGARPTPSEALAVFGESVDDVSDATELAGQLAGTARQAVRLEWTTAVVTGVAERTAGTRSGAPVVTVDIRHRDGLIGRLECGPPVDGTLDAEDETLLRALAAQAGLAIANAQLVARIVEAQEEERRRIERNLHDGAQQELVALVARLALARSRVEAGTLDAASIDELQLAVRRILTDIRELAQGIHPSIVADGGIVAAVEERCARLPIDVTLEAQPGLRRARFPAQIEGAAYFLVAEALANILKHANASHATVALKRQAGRLSISVADNGGGFDPAVAIRRGLAGLDDRFAALGGSVQVASRPGAGTRVSATLPVET